MVDQTFQSKSQARRTAFVRAPASRHSRLEAVADPDLTAVIKTWPDLPPHVREAISVLVGNGDGERKKRKKGEI